jgi:hypothetical protein
MEMAFRYLHPLGPRNRGLEIYSQSPILHEGRVSQGQTARDRRLNGLDGAGDKTGGADALEEHVAAEIIAARPQRRERCAAAHLSSI